MVPDTEFTQALSKPLDVIQGLYSKAGDKSSNSIVKQVESHFKTTFGSDDAKAKIPVLCSSSLNPLLHSASTSPPLVRFRCMIQDTGLGTEVFVATHKQDNITHTGLFGNDARAQHLEEGLSNDNLADRTVMYAVSTPGQTAWAAKAHRESNGSDDVGAVASSLDSMSIQSPQSPAKVQEVRDRIRRAADKAKAIGSTGKVPRLVAISKLHPPSAILAAHQQADQIHFGENYVQEMVDKAKVLPRTIRWHFVGGLQSNKGKLLASIPNLYLLETLDSIKAANVLQKALSSPDAAEREEPLQVYLQVNTSGEEAKSGLPPISQEQKPDSCPLLELAVHVITKCPQLRFKGVMTIGAAANSSSAASEKSQSVDDIVQANPDFKSLIGTRQNLVQMLRSSQDIKASSDSHIKEAYSDLLNSDDLTGGLELSMGMSADMDVATMAGSDNVRVGTDCFGQRPGTRDEAMAGMKRELEIGPEAAMAEQHSSSGAAQRAGPYAQKAPLSEQPHVGALIKFHDITAAEKLKIAELVDVIGVLDTAILPHAEWQDTGDSQAVANTAQAPCIHAILASPTDLNSIGSSPGGSGVLSESGERAELIKYLSGALGGDLVAGELVLLAAIARIHARRSSLCLGALSVNLSNFPLPSGTPHTELYRRLCQVLPSVVDVPMDLDSLNDTSKTFYPKSAGEGTGLEAGRLQLPDATTLLINEGSMREGQLKDTGIRNIRALTSVLEQHKLGYAFPYSEFEFDTDLNAIILSQGKSFLPFDIQCPLQVRETHADLYTSSDSASEEIAEDKLARWRKALLHTRSVATARSFDIPDEVSQHIQHEFVEQRRNAPASEDGTNTGQTDLLRRMALVRLLALSRGQTTLSVQDWEQAVKLDTTLTERIKSTHPYTAPTASR